MPYKSFRLSVAEDLHKRIKLLSIRRRANNLPMASISDIVGQAISDWLSEGQPPCNRPTVAKSKGIQTTFKLLDPEVTSLYTQAIIDRLERDPMRRSGARLDKRETDALLDWWLKKNLRELEPLRV